MDDHFTITIHDDNGIKQLNFHQFVKNVLLYTLIFFGLVALLAVGTILYLDKEVADIEAKRVSVKEAFNHLKEKNLNLNKEIENTQTALVTKKNELKSVSNSLSEIEILIGLRQLEESTLQERVDSAKLTTEHRATLLQFIPNGTPIKYKGITSKFGYRIHPTLKRREFHRGIDMRAKMNTPVYATADGIVEWAGMHKRSGFGKLVILNHNYGFRAYFGHLNKVVVKSKQFVRKGTLIAYTGNSGMSSGPHLHYEIRFIRKSVNPYYFVKWNVKNYSEIFKREKNIPWQSLVEATAQIKVLNPTQTLPLSQREVLSKGR
ncbi:MAG: M23 family metallopeptidase [Campylobacterota bacterium]|nr:M23 family metallopeptidase [Campylobacterota bacterium]